MRLRPGLPFRAIALVLSGGGALGAYEVGVLRVIKAIGLNASIVGATSVGAFNALAWIAHDGDSRPLEDVWASLRPPDIGIRWGVLGLRGIGSFLVAFGAAEALLLLAGLPELETIGSLANRTQIGGYVRISGALELLAWLSVVLAGVAAIRLSGPIDEWLDHSLSATRDERLQHWLGWGLVVWFGLYLAALTFHLPWPLRFHIVALLAGSLLWLAQRPGPLRTWLGPIWLRLMPETGGRGLWRNAARRRLLRDLVRTGNPERLTQREPLIMISACDLATGGITFFVNRWPDPPGFEQALAEAQCDVAIARDSREMVEAAVASSAVPVLYVPVTLRGREYVDGGLFANQPLAAVTAAGADAILLVLVSPSRGPRPVSPQTNLVEIAGRLSELANWRDLHAELRRLPPEFSRDGQPARVCVVEPETPLEGGMFDFDPARASQLVARGEADAWRALLDAGWVIE